jgi:hypothetical protein
MLTHDLNTYVLLNTYTSQPTNSTMNQGYCGSVSRVKYHGHNALKKTSLDADYTMELERDIARDLSSLNCSHFCKYYGSEVAQNGNVTIYTEFIEFPCNDGVMDLASFRCHSKIAKSLLTRSIIAAAIMNEKLDITHNDLHGRNVMVRQVTDCNVAAYVFDRATSPGVLTMETFEFETFGVEPVLIDFGLAFAGINAQTMKTPITFTDIGYFAFETDRLADARRLLTLVDTPFLPENTDNQDYIIYAKEVYDELPLNEDTGYFIPTFPDIIVEIQNILSNDSGCESEPGVSSSSEDEEDEDDKDSCDDNSFIPKPSLQVINLFTGVLQLPLKRQQCVMDMKEAYTRFVTCCENVGVFSKLAKSDHCTFLKMIQVCSVRAIRRFYKLLFKKSDILKVKSCAKHVSLAINNYVVERATSASVHKASLNNLIGFTDLVDVAKFLHHTQVVYKENQIVKIYYVTTGETVYHTITRDEASRLNNGDINVGVLG